MTRKNIAGITAALCVFVCVGGGHAAQFALQPDISQLAGLVDEVEGLKQFIGSMVSGSQADKEALQAQIDEINKDRDALLNKIHQVRGWQANRPNPQDRSWVGWAFTRGTQVTSPGRHCHCDRKWQQ
jgi:hypothetical protein